jgi:hypothetical protein
VCCGEAERSVLTLSEAEDEVDGGARRTAMARPWRLMLPLLVLYSPIVYSQGDQPPLCLLSSHLRDPFPLALQAELARTTNLPM